MATVATELGLLLLLAEGVDAAAAGAAAVLRVMTTGFVASVAGAAAGLAASDVDCRRLQQQAAKSMVMARQI